MTSKRKPSSPTKKVEEKINFQSVFANFCFAKFCEKVPLIKILSQPPRFGQEWKTYSNKSLSDIGDKHYFPVYLQNENFERDSTIEKIFIKNVEIDDVILSALASTINVYNTVTALRINNCKLLHGELYEIYHILKRFPNITELNIDENPNSKQNFFILLRQNNLQYISIQKCKINDRGLMYISNEIKDSTQKLISLDLSSNLISDEGIVHLANTLRTNRGLISLTLTDNWITDKGLEILMKIFRDFELIQEEIEIRRKLNFEYEFKKLQLTEKFTHRFKKSKSSKSSIDIINNKRRKSTKDRSSTNSPVVPKRTGKSSRTSKGSVGSKNSFNEQLELYLLANLKRTDHPLENDCVAENGTIYCLGNFKVSYLNLSYNKITSSGLPCILETLKHQMASAYIRNTGLTNIVLTGNNVNDSDMMEDIKSLLQEKILTSLSRTERGRKRSSLKTKSS